MNTLFEKPFWSIDKQLVISMLQTSLDGLASREAKERLIRFGSNEVKAKQNATALTLFIKQFTSPFILILIFAAILSIFLSSHTDAFVILTIVLASGILGFIQERGAHNATAKLLKLVEIKATVIRDGAVIDVAVSKLVPGDIVIYSAGDVIAADSLLLEEQDLFIDESTLTGETFGVEKNASPVAEDSVITERKNVLFMGTHVVSGTAKAVVVLTGLHTEFGRLFAHLQNSEEENAFEKGIRSFGALLMQVTLLLILTIFLFTIWMHRPVFESFLFALALAVGLTPQLLPVIVTINLAKGAKVMARKKVIVKKLNSIENLGAMDVLCADKTGTLTKGDVELYKAVGIEGIDSESCATLAYMNALMQTGHPNIMDLAILKHDKVDIDGWEKLDELPYDFIRKRVSILAVRDGEEPLLITKGAFEEILKLCISVETAGGIYKIDTYIEKLNAFFTTWSQKGFRILALASKKHILPNISRGDESGMTFLGFLLFYDPPKEHVSMVLKSLEARGVSVKMITGDNVLVASYIAQKVGFKNIDVLTGQEMRLMSDEALRRMVDIKNVFAAIEPNQKERIVAFLKSAGHTVGFLGDGINDITAMHSADVGISVESAVDVAKDEADIVLINKDLAVLEAGIIEGRKTFSNTMKYIFMATSANFGNMFSMAGASLVLDYLPLLPKQILLQIFSLIFLKCVSRMTQ